MQFFRRPPDQVPKPEDCLVGRAEPLPAPAPHFVNGTDLTADVPDGHETLVVGMGCFWGAERLYWNVPGVYSTAVGYAGGTTPNPTYRETCTGMTGHTEAVRVIFDPDVVSVQDLLAIFWENHDPTQFMGQGNDLGTQYRSAIYPSSDEQMAVAVATRDSYQRRLDAAGYGGITTEIAPAGAFYLAEDEHQQYLAKHPGGYCNHGFCQVAYESGETA